MLFKVIQEPLVTKNWHHHCPHILAVLNFLNGWHLFLWAVIPSHLHRAEVQVVDFLNNTFVYILGPCYMFSLFAVIIIVIIIRIMNL